MYTCMQIGLRSGGYKNIKKNKVPKALHVWLTVEQLDLIVS